MDKLTVDQIFAKLVLDLRKIRPFESALYETIDKVEVDYINTMGVTHDKILYNKEFMENTPYEEIKFSIIHELYHIALQHVLRMGTRDMALWNIACDMYINKLIYEEFELNNGGINFNLGIKMPSWIYFDKNVDTDKDCAESIYDKLLEQSGKNGYNSNGVGMFSLSEACGNNESNQGRQEKIEINSKDCDEFQQTDEDQAAKEGESRRILSDAKTRYDMSAEPGNKPGNMYIQVTEVLKSKLDWRKLLRKYCISLKATESSFSRPDKRLSYQQFIYPGAVATDECELKDVKICIDNSGSISEEDLKLFLGQVQDITKVYKTQAELICWDTKVQTTMDFTEVKQLFNAQLGGRGGTSPSCIFEYFDSKQCQLKPKVTIVFTDGYVNFITEKERWKRKYRDTIWVMTKGYNKNFKPPFGKIAIAEF